MTTHRNHSTTKVRHRHNLLFKQSICLNSFNLTLTCQSNNYEFTAYKSTNFLADMQGSHAGNTLCDGEK